MRVIFLDFDGVLNCERYWRYQMEFMGLDPDPATPAYRGGNEKNVEKLKPYLDPSLICNLAWIIKSCSRAGDSIQIVYTTNWKDWFKKSMLSRLLEPIIPQAHSYSIVGHYKLTSERGHDIGWWLDDHKEVTKFAIIDDENLANSLHGDNFFQTDARDGLTMKMAYDIARHLELNDAEMSTYEF